MPPPSFEVRLAVLEKTVEGIASDVGDIKDTSRWILRVLGSAFIVGSVSAIITILVR